MVTCCALRVINTKSLHLNLVKTCKEQMFYDVLNNGGDIFP